MTRRVAKIIIQFSLNTSLQKPQISDLAIPIGKPQHYFLFMHFFVLTFTTTVTSDNEHQKKSDAILFNWRNATGCTRIGPRHVATQPRDSYVRNAYAHRVRDISFRTHTATKRPHALDTCKHAFSPYEYAEPPTYAGLVVASTLLAIPVYVVLDDMIPRMP